MATANERKSKDIISYWLRDKSGIYTCSFCKSEAYWDTDFGQQLFDYCPYCGEKMREVIEK